MYVLQFKTVAPVGDRVFVKVDANEEQSIGGILLPTSAQKKPTKGEVVGMGSAKAVKVCLSGNTVLLTFPTGDCTARVRRMGSLGYGWIWKPAGTPTHVLHNSHYIRCIWKCRNIYLQGRRP